MMRQPMPMRMIQRVEAYLPAFAPARTPVGQSRHGWAVFAAIVPTLVTSVAQFVIHRADLVEAWPVWRPMILELLLVAASAALIATVAAGVHAWRTA